MLQELRLQNFKNFKDATLRLGQFSVIVGANASGKSNVRDALRFLHGIGRGYTLADIVGGKYGAGGQIEWAPLRGATNEIVRFGKSAFTVRVTLTSTRPRRRAKYAIRVRQNQDDGRLHVERESLSISNALLFSTHPGPDDPVQRQDDEEGRLLLRLAKTAKQGKFGPRLAVRPDQPALTQLQYHDRVVRAHKSAVAQVVDELAASRFLDLAPDAMRKPSYPGQTVLGDNGENLPTVLQAICDNKQRTRAFAAWLRELTPMDVRGFSFPRDAVTGLVQLVIREKEGREISAYSASDGSLRFLAMLAALLSTDPARLYVFEEVDNGIHPARLRLLVELIEQQAGRNVQVVSTTHSSEMLEMLGDDTFEHTSVVCRLGDNAVVRDLSELPNARAQRDRRQLGRLHVGGWMENAVFFADDDEVVEE